MGKAKVQPFVPFIFRSRQIVLFLLLTHTIPLLLSFAATKRSVQESNKVPAKSRLTH